MKTILFVSIQFIFTLYVYSQSKPVITMPINGSGNNGDIIDIRWEAVSGAASYKVEYDTSDTFSSPAFSSFIVNSNSTGTFLNYEGRYFLRVGAELQSNTYEYSDPIYFYTGEIITNVDNVQTGLESQVSIYPNPSNGSLNISSKAFITNLHIVSLTGQKIKSFSRVYSVSMDDLPNGIYLVKITLLDGEKIHSKVIVR